MKNKILTGKINYEIEIVDGDINLRFEQSNENHLIAFEMIYKILEEELNRKIKSNISVKELKDLKITIETISKQIPILGNFIMNKYKNAVPEEKKIKLLKYNPAIDKLINVRNK